VAKRKIVCDTNVLIYLLDRHGENHQTALAHAREIGADNIRISAVTKMELIKGIRDREHERKIMGELKTLETVPMGTGTADRAVGLLWSYHLSHGLDIADALVAATAIEMGFPLFTYNTKDFRFIKGLELYVP